MSLCHNLLRAEKPAHGGVAGKEKKVEQRHRYFHYSVYIADNQTIIEQRTGSDIWKNMYQFPLVETDEENNSFGEPTIRFREVLTHQIIHADFHVKSVAKFPKTSDNQIVVNFSDITKYPMPKIMTEFLKVLELQ